MIDSRFFFNKPPITIGEIASRIGGFLLPATDDAILVTGISGIEKPNNGDLIYSESEITESNAIACLIKENHIKHLKNTIPIITNNPRGAFAFIAPQIMDVITETELKPIIEDNVVLKTNCFVSNGAMIGSGTIISENVYIGPNVIIGRNCIIEPGTVIYCSIIGDGVKIGANSVIGKPGFGVVQFNGLLLDVPQYGRVIIQDNVTIGALCTIDRGAFDDTIIGLNSKLDNHCHLAHNVKLGQGVIMAAYGGISGSVTIGDFVMMGGRVGIGDHFNIGAGAKIAAGSNVFCDIPAGQTYGGYPAKPKREWQRELIKISRL